MRAIAIAGVLMTHDLPWSVAGHSNEKWKGYGGWGVQLFFAISGALICWRLLEDEAHLGQIRLRAFYIRRLFRIQPAAFAYLGVVAGLYLAGVALPAWHLWTGAAFSYINYLLTSSTLPGDAAFVGHFWTLAVEEHFYLLLSLLLVITQRRRAVVLTLALALLVAGQTYARAHGYFSLADSPRRTYWLVQYLLFPALLAVLVRLPRIKRFILRYGQPWVATVLILLAMCLNIVAAGRGVLERQLSRFSPADFIGGNDRVIFYGCGLFVICVMLHPQSLTTRFLELRPLRFVGRLSYSLYLWHILFFIPTTIPEHIHSTLLMGLSNRPWRYLLTGIVALGSYYGIEKPFIRLGHRMAPPATAGHRDLSVSTQPHVAPAPELVH